MSSVGQWPVPPMRKWSCFVRWVESYGPNQFGTQTPPKLWYPVGQRQRLPSFRQHTGCTPLSNLIQKELAGQHPKEGSGLFNSLSPRQPHVLVLWHTPLTQL